MRQVLHNLLAALCALLYIAAVVAVVGIGGPWLVYAIEKLSPYIRLLMPPPLH